MPKFSVFYYPYEKLLFLHSSEKYAKLHAFIKTHLTKFWVTDAKLICCREKRDNKKKKEKCLLKLLFLRNSNVGLTFFFMLPKSSSFNIPMRGDVFKNCLKHMLKWEAYRNNIQKIYFNTSCHIKNYYFFLFFRYSRQKYKFLELHKKAFLFVI